jgi:cell wall assembly regulator SMI1
VVAPSVWPAGLRFRVLFRCYATWQPATVDEITLAWAAIDGWLARFAPRSAAAQHPPATAEAISAAEREIGLPFPADVVRSLLHHDGQPRSSTDFPDYPLLPVAEIVEIWQMMAEVAEDLGEEGSDDSDDRWWHRGWLPVSELNGSVNIVDLRPGPGYGRLGWRPKDDIARFDEEPGTFAAYLTRIATALTTGGDVGNEVPYLTEDGVLAWHLRR